MKLACVVHRFGADLAGGSEGHCRLIADRSVRLPTAEADPLIHADVLGPFFALPRAFLFLTPEEQALVGGRASAGVPSAVIGSGLDPAAAAVDGSRLRSLGVERRF